MIDKSTFLAVAHSFTTAIVLKLLGLILPCSISCYYTCTAHALLFLYVARVTFQYTKNKYLSDRIQPENRAVLITGCDSGFGHNLAKRLDSVGYQVFASCLFPDGDGAKLLRKSCSKRLQVLELDVTKDESVKNAVEFVKENLGTSELWAVVNNAGIHKGVSVELTRMEDFVETMDVNAFGPVRVTKAFLPLLRQSRGRVVNVTSLSGRLSAPHLCPYTMSKFAAVAFNECLKQEMDVWGVRVISVEPEIFSTALSNPANVTARLEDCFRNMDKDVKDDYGEKYLKDFKTATEILLGFACRNIQIVIDDLESAISLEHPDYVYKPRRNFVIRLILYIAECIPRNILDYIIRMYCSVSGVPKPKEAENIL